MDLIEGAFGCFLLVIVGVIVLGAGSCAVDTAYYERRAFRSTTACQSRRMEAKRRLFDTAVVCVPINTRQDTTTVNVNAK